jgi:thiol:disulfide interchange protein
MLRTHLFILVVLALFGQGLAADIAELKVFEAPENESSGYIEVRLTIPEGHYQSKDPDFFGMHLSDTGAYRLGEVHYPAPSSVSGKSEKSEIKYRGKIILSAPLYDAGGDSGKPELTVFYQLCQDDGLCLFPEEETFFLGVTQAAGSTAGAAQTGIQGVGTILFYLLLAFTGGLLLNVMPCVLPVLSIKVLSLVRQSNEDRLRIRSHALIFGAGVVVSLLIMGVLVVLLKSAGEAVGWGFQFQNPYYIFTLIIVLIVFALSLFDVWILTFTAGPGMTKTVSRGGYPGSFAAGVFTVLLATPCTAPFLGTALGFAFSQSALIIILIFLAVGTGLALPFTLIGFFPSLVRRLPKPGPWMDGFKEAMGLLLLATAVWLFGILVKQLGSENTSSLLFMLLGISSLVWLWGRFGRPSRHRWFRTFTTLALAAGITASLVNLPVSGSDDGSNTEAAAETPDGWSGFSTEAVEAARAEGLPVFIQFTADWCLTCKTNQLTVFSREDVNDRFEELGVARFYGDYTNKNDEIDSWIKRFNKAGVPVYALYPPGREDPVLLPELLTPTNLINTLNNYLAW